MDNSEAFEPDKPVKVQKNPPLPQPGYGLTFKEQQAQAIAEFVSSPLFKMLKRVYGLQAKDRAARQCLNTAQNTEWLMYYKGIASATSLFFADLQEVQKAFKNKDEEKYKK